MNLLKLFGQHSVEITPPGETGAYGTSPGVPFTLEGVFVTEKVSLVRNMAGDQVASTAQIAVPAGTEIAVEGTTVVLPSGRETRVISVATADPGALPLPAHKIVYCE